VVVCGGFVGVEGVVENERRKRARGRRGRVAREAPLTTYRDREGGWSQLGELIFVGGESAECYEAKIKSDALEYQKKTQPFGRS